MKLAPSWFTYRNVALVLIAGMMIEGGFHHPSDAMDKQLYQIHTDLQWLCVAALLCTQSLLTAIRKRTDTAAAGANSTRPLQ